MKKETVKQNKSASLKVQKQQAIRKAKDILKKAEKARRDSIGKKQMKQEMKSHGRFIRFRKTDGAG